MVNISVNSVDSDQTAPTGADLTRSTLFSKHLQIFQQTTQACECFVICALSVNNFEFTVYALTIFMKCTHVCAAQTIYLLFTK